MLDLKYNEKIHLDKWDIDVKPYLDIEQIDLIYDMIKDEPNPLLRERMIMANVLVACTDLYNDQEECDYTYEQIIYSGLWDDIVASCPYIQNAIVSIWKAVDEYNSIERNLANVVGALSDGIKNVTDKIDNDKLDMLAGAINKLQIGVQ